MQLVRRLSNVKPVTKPQGPTPQRSKITKEHSASSNEKASSATASSVSTLQAPQRDSGTFLRAIKSKQNHYLSFKILFLTSEQ